MSNIKYEAGARIGSIKAQTFTTSSAAYALDFSDTTKPITMIADQDIYYAFGASGDSIDEIVTSGSQQCAILKANTERRVVPGATHVIAKGASSAGILRLWLS